MSGGSYDYLCNAVDRGLSTNDLETIKRMRDRLLQLAVERDSDPQHQRGYAYAAARTQWVIEALTAASSWADAMSGAWRAVEWLDSNDWGPEQTDNEIEKWFTR